MFANRSFVRSRHRRQQALVVNLLVLALLIGVCVLGIGAFVHFSSSQSQASSDGPSKEDLALTTEIIVPIQDIDVGAALEPSFFRRERKPNEAVAPEIVKDLEEVNGMYSRGLLIAGQPIHHDYLTTLQPVNKLTASIPLGHRAVAINVDAVTSVEGWAQAGARVDVLWTTSATGEKLIIPVSQNAKILSANRQTEATGNSADPQQKQDQARREKEGTPSTVTILMTTRDALKTRLASLNGKLSLVLRGTTDSGRSAGWRSMAEGEQWAPKANQKELTRNITKVQVKDRKTGQSESILFENGQRITE